MITRRLSIQAVIACLSLVTASYPLTSALAGPKLATVLIIRHAEKPEHGDGLTPAGEAHAKAYVEYFKNLQLEGQPLKPDEIFAAADSKNSRRPRLTVEPLAQALGLTVNYTYNDKNFPALVNALQAGHDGKTILVCWHHGPIADLVRAFGADPGTVLPNGLWPADEYNWLIVLRFDAAGKLRDAQRLVEKL